MPFAGRSHIAFIVVLGVWIVVVFVACARLTGATRREWVAALLGGVVAGAVNVATDAAAYRLGYWQYPEATTTFGPLLYYAEAGLGCGALALIARWMRRRWGARAVVIFIVALGVYAPIRDWATAEATGLIQFHYDPWPVVILADALSSFVIPVTVAYGVLALLVRTDSHRSN
jgi:hypothetical protein